MSFQNCPSARMSDTSQLAFRQCGYDGLWLGRRKNESSSLGWTNYTPCFPDEVQQLFNIVYTDEKDPQAMFRIAQNTRYLEIFGFSLSFVALVISIIVFSRYPALRNMRTQIHRNLFIAMLLQVVIRLVLYLDQAMNTTEADGDPRTTYRGLESVPYLCEACYILLEYGLSAMFSWMFVEGLYLNSVVTSSVLQQRISYKQFCFMGWGFSVITTGIWATLTAIHYSKANVQQCWYGYNFLSIYWVSQGPRTCEVSVNFCFLINIVRVVISKLNETENTEIGKARKATRAAFVLLPLLGITNMLSLTSPPLNSDIWKFALWSYFTHFLRSFQGFFVAFIYCFLNAEVRAVLVKHYTDWSTFRNDQRLRRQEAERRRRRMQSPTEEFGWNQEEEEEIDTENGLIKMDFEHSEYRKCSLYRDSDVLDQLQTIRFDDDANAADRI